MSILIRSAVSLALAGACAATAASQPAPRAAARDLVSRYNAAGQPVVDAQGRHINYGREAWKHGDWSGSSNPAALRPAPTSTAADWTYASLGYGIGEPGLVSELNAGKTEIYAGNSSYWYALSWNGKRSAMDQIYTSPPLSAAIRAIAVSHSPAGNRIIVGLSNGYTLGYDQGTKKLLWNRAGSCAAAGGMTAMTAADLNGDGNDEVIAICADQTLRVHDETSGDWQVAGVTGSEIVVAQMDNDAALEIATTGGQIVDSGSRSVQWYRSAGFGYHLQAADIDSDGRAELIAAEGWNWVSAYDVERQLPKWTLGLDHDVAAIRMADINGDGVLELLAGDGQWGSIHVFNAQTLTEIGSIGNPEHGITRIEVADLNGDGNVEVLWGAGQTSSGPDHLYVAKWSTREIVWESLDLVGPFIGPVMGDLDGDGIPELVAVSWASDSGYGSGRILVFDGRTRNLRAISNGVADGVYSWTGVHDIKLRDVDGDHRPEIVIATDYLYDGLIEAYKFNASNQFTRVWRNATRPVGAPFYSVEVADVDADGKPDVLGGVGWAHSGSAGYFIYAYDNAAGAEKWHTLQTGGTIADLVIGDYNGDGKPEIVGQVWGTGLYVFDGLSQLLAIETLPSTTLTSRQTSNGWQLIVGQVDGKASIRQFNGQSYPEVDSVNLGSNPIDGIYVTDSGNWWVGSDTVLRRYSRTGVNFVTPPYGTWFGRRVAGSANSSWIYSAGGYGVHGFNMNNR